MTNEELKKKIINLLDEATGSWYEDEDGMFAEGYSAEEGDNRFKAHVADALIAAGLKFDTIVSHTATFDLMQQEQINRLERRCAQAEHRAQVAERALGNACEDVKEVVSFLIELSERVDGLRVEGYLPEESEPKAYINRAEKELAEEKKDE